MLGQEKNVTSLQLSQLINQTNILNDVNMLQFKEFENRDDTSEESSESNMLPFDPFSECFCYFRPKNQKSEIFAELILERVNSRIVNLFPNYEQVEEFMILKTKYIGVVEKRTIKDALADLAYFEEDSIDLMQYTADILKREIDFTLIETYQEKKLRIQLELILKSSIVLFMSYYSRFRTDWFPSIDYMLNSYQEFKNTTEKEQRRLLTYCNVMRTSLKAISPRQNKELLIRISEKLEFSGQEYITGGGQTEPTKRRVLIYEREGNILPVRRVRRVKKEKRNKRKRVTFDDVALCSDSEDIDLEQFEGDELEILQSFCENSKINKKN